MIKLEVTLLELETALLICGDIRSKINQQNYGSAKEKVIRLSLFLETVIKQAQKRG